MKLIMTRFALHNLRTYLLNLLGSKLASNINSLADELASQIDKKKEYMNEYQQMLFDFMHSLPLADQLKDELHKVVLAAQVHNAPDFIRAKNIIFKIAMDIKEGVLTVASTLRAVFKGAYSNAVERCNNRQPIDSSIVEDKARNEHPVPFYNWLNERDGRPQISSNRPCNLENWLE